VARIWFAAFGPGQCDQRAPVVTLTGTTVTITQPHSGPQTSVLNIQIAQQKSWQVDPSTSRPADRR
jgi:hypothetical protein